MDKMVSAIITTHNRKALLMRAIKSVLNQTYSNIECIVVDDASDDGTDIFLNDLIEKKIIKYIRIEKHQSKGGNHARNVGIYNSTGSYIAFLDDDDEWLSDKIEKQVLAMESEENIGFVYCGRIDERDFSVRKQQDIRNPKFKEGDLSKEILIHILAVTSTIMVRKDVLIESGCFDEELMYWQEYEMTIRVLQKTRVKVVRENLVLYRVISKDTARISNKINGWENSVDYIERKYSDLLSTLNEQDENLRQLYICIDGINRAKNVGSLKYKFKYGFRAISNWKIAKELVKKIYHKYFRGYREKL